MGRQLTSKRNGLSVAQLGSRDFERYVAGLAGCKWFFVFFGMLGAAAELLSKSPRPWAVAADLALVALGTTVVWRYEHRITSVRALFLMIDGVATCLGLLLPLGLQQFAHAWAKNYWLYENYWYMYTGVFAVLFIYLFFLHRGEFLSAMTQRVSAIRRHADRGEMTAQELWGLLTNMRGAKEAQRGWATARYAAIFAPLSVSFTAMAAWQGGDGMLYVCFLLGILVVPIMVAPVLRRRVMLLRALGSRDVVLVARPAVMRELMPKTSRD